MAVCFSSPCFSRHLATNDRVWPRAPGWEAIPLWLALVSLLALAGLNAGCVGGGSASDAVTDSPDVAAPLPDAELPDVAAADIAPPDMAHLTQPRLTPPLACPADVTLAAMLPGDPSAPASCASWIRLGASADGERADGKIAICDPATGERRVYGADGALLAVDQAVPLAESLTSLGTGYFAAAGPNIQRFDGDGKLQWTTTVPDYVEVPFTCGGIPWVFDGGSSARLPEGR